MTYDLKITGGTIVDGTGRPGEVGDVGIRDGGLVALGSAPGAATSEIDARGKVVAPGFVDIHTHYDAQILWDRMLSISPWHGVTTVVVGNCGFGIAPTRREHRGLVLQTLEKVEGMSLAALEEGLGDAWEFETFPEYLDAIERRGMAINVGVLLGHTPLRLHALGEEASERPASGDEIERMRLAVREALDAGALGFATSKSATHIGYAGRPVPSRLAEFEEIRRLASALGEGRQGILQATFGRDLFLEQFAVIARETGRPITWTALLGGMLGPNGHRGVLEQTEKLVADGLQIVPQVTGRPLNFEFDLREPFLFESLAAFKPVSAADLEGKKRIYRDAAFRSAFREKAGGGASGTLAGRWGRTAISYCPQQPDLEGRSVATVAAQSGIDPVDLVLDLSLDSNLQARFRMAVLNFDEAEVAELLSDQNTVLGLSDAGAHASQLCDACFATHLLQHWVREKGVLRLEEAVRMLTSRPADLFGIADRGRLVVGNPADVVVFDPDTVGAGPLRRAHDLPAGSDRLVSDAHGIDAVIVNGVVVRSRGADEIDQSGRLPGRLLRHGRGS